MRVLFIYPNLTLVSTLPNNISILSAVLKENGHKVELFDTTYYKTSDIINDEKRVDRLQVKPFNIEEANIQLKKSDIKEDLRRTIKRYNPDLIGISIVDDVYVLAKQLLNEIKEIPIIAGGVTAMFATNHLFNEMNIDYTCRGEGEKTILNLANNLEDKKPIDNIENLSYIKNNKIINNPLGYPLDLNQLPFEDFSIFENKRFYRPMSGKMRKTIPINFDRGCPYSCTFCCAPNIRNRYLPKGYYRKKKLNRIRDELSFQIEKYKPDFLYFNSETFLARSTKSLKEFADIYKEFEIPFWAESRVETITDEKIKILRDMGCFKLSLGIESGNENYRMNFLNKRFTNKQTISAIEILHKYDIDVSLNNILGSPEETRDMIFDTINLNRKLNEIHPSVSINGFCFQPYVGTQLRKYCIDKGYMEDVVNTDTPIGNPVIDNPYLSKEELIGLLNTFVLYIKLPKKYFPMIKKAEKDEEMLNKLKEIYWNEYS